RNRLLRDLHHRLAGQALVAPDRGEPRLYLRNVADRVDIEPVRGDGLDGPPVGECSAQLVGPDPARAPVAWLPITEAHQVIRATRLQHGCEARDIRGAVLVTEHVEHAAVDDGVEGAAQLLQVE